MFRILKLIIFVIIIGFVSNFISSSEGSTTINWMGWGVELSTDIFIFILLIMAGLIVFIDRIWILLFNIPKLAIRRLNSKNSEKVEQKLVKAFLLASHGEFVLAAKEAALISKNTKDKKLGKLLKDHLTVVNNLNVGSDNKKDISQNYFKILTDEPTTAFVGHLALMRQAIIDQTDINKIISEGEKALKFEPNSKQILEVLFYSYAKIKDLKNSLKHLKTLKNLKYFDTQTYKFIAADLNYLNALDLIEVNDSKAAMNFLKEAIIQNPGHILVAITLCNMITGIGSKTKAINYLEKAFLITAHPEILLELSKKWNLKTSGSRVSKAIDLLNKKSISKIYNDLKIEIASYAASEEIWGEANKLLDEVPKSELTKKAYKTLSDIANSQNDIEKTKNYLESVANAKHGANYFCVSCGINNNKWELHCPKCDSLSTIRWTKIEDINFQGNNLLSKTNGFLDKNLIEKKK